MPRKPYHLRYAEYLAALDPNTPLLEVVRNQPEPTEDELAEFLEWSDIAHDPAVPPEKRDLAEQLLVAGMPGKWLVPNFNPNPGRLTHHQARSWKQQQAARRKLGLSTDPPKPKSKRRTPVSAHGNRSTSGDLLDAVRQSGAKSKPEYERWRNAQPKPEDWPTYKTLQRRYGDKRRKGESAWQAVYRLAHVKP